MVRQREVRERERRADRLKGMGGGGGGGGGGDRGKSTQYIGPNLIGSKTNQGQEQKLDMTKGAAGYYPSLQVQ